MADCPMSPFQDPSRHAAIAAIIRARSTNAGDVREFALRDMDLSGVRRVLDLGCGFGFMAGFVAGRVAPDAWIVGLDACPANERPFLECVRATRRDGEFVCQQVDARLGWPDRSFDLVVASYSLYFFPGVIPEVARVLSPRGSFVALTHEEASCRDLLRAAQTWGSQARMVPISRQFSAEAGGALLAPWFGQIERVDYPNSLVFEAEHGDELLAYLGFKLPFVAPGWAARGKVPEAIQRAALVALAREGRVALAKNDAAFRCRSPQCP
jgi:ubiquinone/menaquinone biosynthesis C-methylase UbiE